MSELSYTLTGTTLAVRAQTTQKPNFNRNMSITLLSSDSSRAIAIMTGSGADWQTITPDLTSTNSITVAILAPIYDIRATGLVDDILEIVQ